MNVESSLSFAWTPWTVAFAVVAVAVTFVLSVIACQRTGYRRSTVLLEALRMLAVVIAATLLGGPEWVQQIRPETRPVVVVLIDDSESMTTRDVVENSGATTRLESIETLGDPATWSALSERAEVRIQRTSAGSPRPASVAVDSGRGATGGGPEPTDEPGTDLAAPLLDIATTTDHLLGVVLASDGDWNVGSAPVAAASRLRLMNVPVFTFPTGSRSKLPDLEIVSFDVPTFAVAGKPVRIPFSIDSSLPRDQVLTLTMKAEAGEEITHEVRVSAMGRTSDAMVWLPEETGDSVLTLNLPKHPDEIRDDNNVVVAPIQIRQERLRVLVIESLPRWEYRYLRNALSRDPGVEVSCLLFHPGLDKRGGGNADYIKEFPASKEELAKFDVVFLGDVGIGEGQLTVEQCDWLSGLVREQASGLVFLPGWLGNEFSLLETELADLMPVTLDETQPGGWGSRTSQHFELSELGRRSLLTKLADTPEENLQVWENLPGFQWYAPVVSAKPGTETLAVHAETSNQYGRLPLLVTRTFGAGKVLFMATDGAWRWRKGVEDLYHYRFWGQVVRWMAYQRNMVQGETMRLYYSPEQPTVRQTVTLTANVMETSGEPLAQGNVTLRVTPPSGPPVVTKFDSISEAWGAFSVRWTPRRAGQHRVTLSCVETKQSLDTSITVRGVPLEQIGKPARPDVLEEISRVTRGQTLAIDRVDDVVASLAAMPDPPPITRRMAIWSHPAVAALFLTCLATFWIARKGVGLI